MHQNIRVLTGQGQSIWYDNIDRSLLDSGELERLIREGIVTGLTSNPTIFEKAVSGSSAYDSLIDRLAKEGAGVPEIYLELVTRDIRDAADLLMPVYESTGGWDGYVSVEVSPELAGDTDGTVKEALALSQRLARPNLLIKVPGTRDGVAAIEQLTARGISVNVTLLFSVSQYRAAVEAYLAGLEKRLDAGGSLRDVASVASFFVSRVDTLVDKLLRSRSPSLEATLGGKAAVANAKVVCVESEKLFAGPRWDRLVRGGARAQRLLWASTSTKDPRYPDTLYVDRLIAPDTINTVPPKTLAAFIDHGTPVALADEDPSLAADVVQRLKEQGIDLEQVGEQLQREGVAAFRKSMESLLHEIGRRLEELV